MVTIGYSVTMDTVSSVTLNVTENLTFVWLTERWEAVWADTPDDVPEWDISRVGQTFAFIFAKNQSSNALTRVLAWTEYRDGQGIDVKPPPEPSKENYPRLIFHHHGSNFTAGAYRKRVDRNLIESIFRIYKSILIQNPLNPGSETRNLILKLVNEYSPFARYLNDLEELSLGTWLFCISRIGAILETIRTLNNAIELDLNSMDEVKRFVKEREEDFNVRQAIKEGIPLTWKEIKPIVDRCSKPAELRQELAKYLINLFGSGNGIRFTYIEDDLVLSAQCGTIAWAHWLVAQQIRNPIKGKNIRQCGAEGCTNIIFSGLTCSVKCRKKKSRATNP